MRNIGEFVGSVGIPYVRGSVLDVGGGWGRWKETLKPLATEYFISDLFAENADFKDDARKLSNADNSFDTVVCFEALEHIDDTRAVVGELFRVLKPGGFCIASAPFMYPQHGNPNDFYRFTPEGFKYLFEQVGFTVYDTGRIGSLRTVLAVICKSRHKRLAKTGHYWQSKLYLALYLLLSKLPPKRGPRSTNYYLRKQPGKVISDPFFFTGSYIIAKKEKVRVQS